MRFQKNCTTPLRYPLTQIPAESTGLVSPVIGSNEYNVPTPIMPENVGFEDLVYEVVHVRQDVLKNQWSNWFFEDHGVIPGIPAPLYKYGGIRDARSAAQAVHMDAPVDLLLVLLEWLNKDARAQLAGPAFSPGSGHVDFLQNPVGIIGKGSFNISKSLTEAFKVKYYYGAPRPEECTDIGNSFTAYPEGCPAHPAYVAGHGAMAGATYATLADVFNLTEDQDQVIKSATQHFAMYRTLAGVHFQPDNREGWRLGVAVTQGLDSVGGVSW